MPRAYTIKLTLNFSNYEESQKDLQLLLMGSALIMVLFIMLLIVIKKSLKNCIE